jgi:uncharacterized protein (TIGR03083 family)
MSSPSRPVTQLDKADVLSGLFASWDALDRLLTELPEEQWQTPTSLPGWSVHAVISHIIGTESALLGVPTPDADIDVSALEHVRNDFGATNECWVRHLSAESGADLIQRFRAVTGDRRKYLTDMSDDDWNAPTQTPAGLDSYGRFMRVRVFDSWMHEHDIRDALGRPASDAELDGPAARLALDEMAASMGFVVGKLGGAPDGSRVRLELTGPLARTINVVVDGKARVVDDFGGQEPTATITLDGLLFARLAGGRQAVNHDAVSYGGDEAVGKRIVEHLNYVI